MSNFESFEPSFKPEVNEDEDEYFNPNEFFIDEEGNNRPYATMDVVPLSPLGVDLVDEQVVPEALPVNINKKVNLTNSEKKALESQIDAYCDIHHCSWNEACASLGIDPSQVD